MTITTLSLMVVGVDYQNQRGPARRFEVELCAPGDPVELVPEPKNPVDPHAIKVMSERGVQLGYLTAERAPWIGSQMSSGADVRAIFQAISGKSAIIRVTLDGSDPVLPPPPLPREPEPVESFDDGSGFYPDYIPPDD
ncbi:HIRAN domain-containing protein [Sphingomonas arantia]|uniref:HIRAN domain-containing protein n=1 Tax=Sphingomonas arantia TaxID=1460676 RepID=A0ABW4U2R3_9SPHN